MKYVSVKFNSDLFIKNIYSKKLVKEQTKRLEEYAQKELIEMVSSHDFKNDTYNLQDSFVWVLFFNGEKRSHGFYGGGRASENSMLHAWGTPANRVPVNGRELAETFVGTFEPTVKSGWEIVWAAVAPYGAYLESGSTPHGVVFRVITQRFDDIKQTLEPQCKVTFEINKPA